MSNVKALDVSVMDSLQPPGRVTYRHPRAGGFYHVWHDTTSVSDEHTNSVTDFEAYFQVLAMRIKSACSHLSSVHEIERHPDFEKIVAMGRTMIPLILREIEDEPNSWWFSALRRITGENAVKPQNSGIAKEMSRDWFEWAESEGLRW